MIDSNAAVREWLLSDSAITALVGQNVYWPRLPQGYTVEKSGPAITFFVRGGSSETETPIIYPSVQIECWAGIDEYVLARQIYRAVFDLLHGKNEVDLGAAGFVLSCIEEVQGQDGTDPETGWATTFSYFRLMMRST